MANLKVLGCLALAGISFGCMALSPGTTQTVYMVKTNLSAHPEEGDEGHRIPGRHIACSLDRENGVRFLGQETPDFILYEIYDSNNTCVGAYGDEPEFIDALFSLTGEYRITLSTAEVSYIGYVIL